LLLREKGLRPGMRQRRPCPGGCPGSGRLGLPAAVCLRTRVLSFPTRPARGGRGWGGSGLCPGCARQCGMTRFRLPFLGLRASTTPGPGLRSWTSPVRVRGMSGNRRCKPRARRKGVRECART